MAPIPGHDHPISAFHISAILLIMTSQGRQFPTRKVDQCTLDSRDSVVLECSYIYDLISICVQNH